LTGGLCGVKFVSQILNGVGSEGHVFIQSTFSWEIEVKNPPQENEPSPLSNG